MTRGRRLFLVRHGRVDMGSREFRESPRGRQWDPPLDERGRGQAELLARRLLHWKPPAALYSSPFRRCLETIRPYATQAGLSVASDEGVGEVFVGEWEGKTFEEIIAGDEELARRFRDQEAMFSISPGGEGGEALRARVRGAVEAMLARHPEGDVMVVTHGGVINAYLAIVLGIDRDMFFLPEHASINTVLADGARRRVLFLNDVRHLTDPAVFAAASEGPGPSGSGAR